MLGILGMKTIAACTLDEWQLGRCDRICGSRTAARAVRPAGLPVCKTSLGALILLAFHWLQPCLRFAVPFRSKALLTLTWETHLGQPCVIDEGEQCGIGFLIDLISLCMC